MINRIVVIGNGFDLAHGMKTSYKDFFAGYWDFIKNELIHSIERHNSEYEIKDKLCTISLKDHTFPWYIYLTNNGYAGVFQLNGMDFYNKLRNDHNVEIKPSPFFKRICTSVDTKNWVDIENEYYKLLKDIAFERIPFYSIDNLNEELEYVKSLLTEYLKSISINTNVLNHEVKQPKKECEKSLNLENSTKEKNYIRNIIKDTITSPLTEVSMSVRGKKIWNIFKNDRLKWSFEQWCRLKEKYRYEGEPLLYYNKDDIFRTKMKNEVRQYEKNSKMTDEKSILFCPDNILLLNFNYTDTASDYLPLNKHSIVYLRIHGNVWTPKEIIFGYGDELDSEFKNIENLNDNRYLKNIKSTCYLETSNYRTLLDFMEIAPYQVITMGHSCGNSDRTLLNTLFEHENCISIKPYYYQYKDKSGYLRDNYTDIVQNIYRNFTNKADVRDKVVNKTYCNPLIPVDKLMI